ncbi:unnamed protein product, partial [Brugia timori]
MADYRDLCSWINDMKAVISADELAKDVAGAEALLESHQEHRGEIDAREDSFMQTAEAGQKLLDEGIEQSNEVRDKLTHLAQEKASLLSLWEERRILYEQCMDLQLFYRDTEQAETWMTKQETFLSNDDLGDNLDSVESLIKKHEDFEKSLAAQEEKINALDEFATKLIQGQHYAAGDVGRRRASLLDRRKQLMKKVKFIDIVNACSNTKRFDLSQKHILFNVDASERRHQLENSYRLQQFDRDCDEMVGWIKEKLKTAKDDSYLDPTNIRGKLQKHLNYEQELKANKNRLDDINLVGSSLVKEKHYAASHVQDRLSEVNGMWDELVDATAKKGAKLKEAGDQQQFNRNIEDIELWLSELEGQLASEDYGKDLISVQNLQKKLGLLESDYNAHQDRIDVVKKQAQIFHDGGHFDAPMILRKEEALRSRFLTASVICYCLKEGSYLLQFFGPYRIVTMAIAIQNYYCRYDALRDPLNARKDKLGESLRGNQLFRDIDDELAWIREKEQIAGSSNRGRDLIGVQNLIKKQQALIAEIANHESQVEHVGEAAEI